MKMFYYGVLRVILIFGSTGNITDAHANICPRDSIDVWVEVTDKNGCFRSVQNDIELDIEDISLTLSPSDFDTVKM